MKLKMMTVWAALCVTALHAAPQSAVPANEGPAAPKVLIDQFPRMGNQCRMSAPSLDGASTVGRCYTKPRNWIVLETKYSTYARATDRLTFTWHVLLDTSTATERDKSEKLSPYSYLTTSVSYVNIPKGSHAASVCLHPSYLERYGEPRAVGLVVTSSSGEELPCSTSVSEIKGIQSKTKFWENSQIMNATDASGMPMIERRQGLVDRSKTIWALVNPNDYEMVVQ